MKVYKILGCDCVHADSLGHFLHKEKAKQELRRIQELYNKWDNEGIEPPENYRRITSYYTFEIVELEVQE